MLKVQQPVGPGAPNKPADVAVIQFLLGQMLRFDNGQPHYKGPIDGKYNHTAFIRAIKRFTLDLPRQVRIQPSELREYYRNRLKFTPNGVAFKWLSTWTSDNVISRNGGVIPGSAVFYLEGNKQAPTTGQGDFLIPGTMPVPNVLKLADGKFATKFEAVSLQYDRFRVELSLVGIKCIIDPVTFRQQPLRASKPFLALAKKSLQSTAWNLAENSHASVANSIDLISKQATLLGDTHRKIINSGFFPRALGQDKTASQGIRIPSRQQISQMITELYTAVCAGRDRLPKGVTIDAKVQQVVKSIVREAPDINPGFVERQCRTCEQLKQSNDAAWKRIGEIETALWTPEMRKDIQKLEESRLLLSIAAKDTSGIGAAIDVAVSLATRAAKLSLPFIVDSGDLVNGRVSLDFGDAVDITQFISKRIASSKSLPKSRAAVLRAVSRLSGAIGALLLVADAVVAVVKIVEDERSIGEQVGDIIDRVYFGQTGDLDRAVAFMEERGNDLAAELQDIALQLEGQRVILEANGYAMERAECPQPYYFPEHFNVQGT